MDESVNIINTNNNNGRIVIRGGKNKVYIQSNNVNLDIHDGENEITFNTNNNNNNNNNYNNTNINHNHNYNNNNDTNNFDNNNNNYHIPSFYIIHMIKTIINNDIDKHKFSETFGMFQKFNGPSNNNFPNSTANTLLQEFTFYDEFEIENIPLPVFQYSFQVINYECIPTISELMFKTPIQAYLISGKVNQIKIQNDYKNIIVQDLTDVSIQWINDNKTDNSIILFLPSAGVFFHPYFFYNINNNIVFQPIDSKYLLIECDKKNVKPLGWLESFDHIYKINSCKPTVTNIINCLTLDNNEICIPPNHWNQSIKKVNINLGPKLHLRQKNLLSACKQWNKLSYKQKISLYNELVKKDTTNKKFGKCIVPYLLYKNMKYPKQVKRIQTSNLKPGNIIVLKILVNNPLNPNVKNLSIIKISKIDRTKYKDLNNYLESAMLFLKNKINNQNVLRKNDGQLGKMIAFGEQSMCTTKNQPIGFYQDTYKLLNAGILTNFMKEYKKMFSNEFPLETSILKSYAPCYNEYIPEEMGGHDGITKTMNCSKRLINPPHVDGCDLGISVSLWTELKPNNAKSWEFLLPSCVSTNPNDKFEGIVISLSDGVIISWDGKIKHCSSVGEMSDNNEVYGWQVTNNIVHLQNFLKKRKLN